MTRAQLTLSRPEDRQRATNWIEKAPAGTRIIFKDGKRTQAQNDRMWAALTDIASQLQWHGVKLSTEDWKLLFMDSLNQEMRLVPNLNNNGFVNLGRSSSNLSKAEFSQLIELIHAFGANHNVVFHDPESKSWPAQ
jgi:hypothetical protein